MILVSTAAIATTLAVLTCATDLLIEHRTEERLAARASRRLKADGPVHADLTTPLARLRILGGDVGDVESSAKGVRRQHAVPDVTVRLKDVMTNGDSAGGTGTATVACEQVTRRLDALGNGLTAGGQDGDLVLHGSVGRLGLPVTVRAALSTTAHALTITPTRVSVLGRSVPVGDLAGLPATAGLRDEPEPTTVPFIGLPRGISLTSAHTTDDGLALGFSIAAGPTPGTGGKTVAGRGHAPRLRPARSVPGPLGAP
ncbi:LmeA family phospholipid-binding protein [Streptomyces sp. NPDC048304]|uniref:LmeA family phospholipid-binding protein n=1 Tax=Streptomyces sp. NPDC048304 TaxID=3154820 RepID=UPI0033EE892D